MKINYSVKSVSALLALVYVVFAFTSCAKKSGEGTLLYYNCCTDINVAAASSFALLNGNECVVKSVNGETERSFICDPFYTEEKDGTVSSVFSDGESFYALLSGEGSYEILSQNPKTLKTKTVYKKTLYNNSKEIFFGAAKTGGTSRESFFSESLPRFFAIFENRLFTATAENLSVINLKSGKETILCDTFVTNSSLSYRDGVVYYIDSFYDIYAYTISSGALQKAENVKATTVLATEKGLYYCTVDGKLFMCNADFSNTECIAEINAISMDFYGEDIYFAEPFKQKAYKLGSDGAVTEVSETRGCTGVFVIKESGVLIVSYLNGDGEKSFEFSKIQKN